MLTHIVRHVLGIATLTNFKLGTRMEDSESEDNDPHQPQAP